MTRGYHYTAYSMIPYCNTNTVPKTKQEEGQLYIVVTWRRVLREAQKLGTIYKSQQAPHLLAPSCHCTAEKTSIHVKKTVK